MPSPLRQERNLLRKERTRALLLDAGVEVFVTKGYHRTLISDIVAAAGVGQGTFYRFFDGKRSLFMTLMDGFFADLLAEFSPMSAHLPTCLDEYRQASMAAVRRVARKLDDNRDLARMLLREAPSIDPDAEKRLVALYDQCAQLAQFYLDHAIEHGFARPCNSAIVSQALIGMGARMMQNWFDRRFGEVTLELLSREVVDLAFLGFGLPEASPPAQHSSEET